MRDANIFNSKVTLDNIRPKSKVARQNKAHRKSEAKPNFRPDYSSVQPYIEDVRLTF